MADSAASPKPGPDGHKAANDPAEFYELLDELGKGSYGAVYKARDLRTQEVVAIKVISLLEADEGLEEIKQEIEMLQQCNHPNVVRYLGSFQADDYLWIVMEYCGGGSVADLIHITDEPLHEPQIAYVCREALKGLAYLHGIFKLHRDIKGGNILMTETGEVKLGDFGVAAQLTRTMSKRNTFIGTPHWMAPEVIQENRYDGKVDVWALGVTAIELAEGMPPRSNVHPMRVIFMISREPPPMLEDKEKWSLMFHDFVAKCLAKDPRVRPTTAALLTHKFIDKSKQTATCMVPLLETARELKAERKRSETKHEESATVSSTGHWSWGRGGTVRVVDRGAESIMDTMIVKGDVGGAAELDSGIVRQGIDTSGPAGSAAPSPPPAVTQAPHITEQRFARPDQVGPSSAMSAQQLGLRWDERGGQQEQSTSPGATGALGDTAAEWTSSKPTTPQLPDDRLPSEYIGPGNEGALGGGVGAAAAAAAGGGAAAAGLPVFGAQPGAEGPSGASRRTQGLGQEKLLAVFAAGSTVPIPVLRATDVAPLALLGSTRQQGGVMGDQQDGGLDEALRELYGGGGGGGGEAAGGRKGKKKGTEEVVIPPGVYQRLTASTTLPNLVRALAYQKRRLEATPLQPWQVREQERTVNNLSDTLRTILRL